MKAHPSDVVLIGRIFIGFYYCRGGKAVTIAEYLTGEISPAHLVIPGLDTSAKLPPLSVLIGLNESLLFIVQLLYELIDLILGEIVFLVHLVLKHILETELEFHGLRKIEPSITED